MRRVRASFLLRCVILAFSVVIFAAIALVGNSNGWTLGFLAFLVLFWFVCVQGGFLPILIEHLLMRHARISGDPIESIWFVDLDRQAKRTRDDSYERTRKNPTIR
jgi:hypothetical protein